MKKKIFYSIFTVALAVLLASLGLATSFLYSYFNTTQISRLKEELSLVEDTVNEIGVEYFENFDSTVFRFTVVDPDGTVRYDTQVDTQSLGNHADREEIAEAFATGSGSSARNSDTLTRKTFYEAVRLDSGSVLRISISQLTLGALLLRMLPFICAIVGFSAAIALLFSHGMAKKITEPLMELDLEHPVENNPYEELTPIVTKLHGQHKQIKAQLETLRRKNDEFEQIVASMKEGLALLDEQGMVLSMNVAARRIFSVPQDPKGKDFLLIDRSKRMNQAIWLALEGEHREYTEAREGCEYQFTVSPIASDGKILGVVILAFDITDRAFAERNRQEFTANVSHELKTPLQSIIGSAELLESGLVKPEDQGKFVGNIRKEAARLVTLINDIIRLSQLDENLAPATESVDLLEVAREAVADLGDAGEKKHICLSLTGSPCRIYGVRRYLYEIVYNLCDNAIRYTQESGQVTVTVAREEGRSILTVADNGIGIAPEHQSRIFERFYRVDKSHSKESGGTGLGLSIVKHAVQHHGGRLHLDSSPGKGTRVQIIF